MPISNILYVKICEVSIPFSFIKLKYSLTIFSLSSNIMLKFSSNSNKKNLSNKKAENQNEQCQESKKKINWQTTRTHCHYHRNHI